MHSDKVEKTRIRLWDFPVRLFHWALVVAIGTAWWTNQEAIINIHELAGYTVLTLVLFRIIWGFVGSSNARFKSFVKSPFAAVAYLRKLPKGSEEELAYAGHNPAGGLMVVVLLLLVAVQAFTGLFTSENTFLFFDGPLVKYVPSGFANTMNYIHHANINLIYIAVGLHVVASIGYLFLKNENLIGAMITGTRKVPASIAARFNAISFKPAWQGLLILVICAGIVAAVITVARAG
ncbi:cytochrome b/b6 domain-containing protein [Thalassospira mesophila]|uniref:Cytochrome B6 n=1 Tax=Thalassospira mesophila TaxID=1293891 RepID=A0A1Y2KVZ8_9PROT|nr:cytochrome b/b6 domain-containing protein [Thalassospira mesophila]OSQ36105.1 cytochrome B6 [Thalassospira mesophila]